MTKLDKACYYATKQVENHAVYVWSGQGEKLRKVTAVKIAAMETSADNAARVMRFIYAAKHYINKNTRIFDCSGLICCILIYAKVFSKGSDYTAKDLYPMFDSYSIESRRPGDLIFKKNNSGQIYHVGFVLNYDEAIEAKGRDYGIVKSRIDSSWTLCCRPNY